MLRQKIIQQLIKERERQKLTKREIAERWGVTIPRVTRFESVHGQAGWDSIETYASVLGVVLEVNLVQTKQTNQDEKE